MPVRGYVTGSALSTLCPGRPAAAIRPLGADSESRTIRTLSKTAPATSSRWVRPSCPSSNRNARRTRSSRRCLRPPTAPHPAAVSSQELVHATQQGASVAPSPTWGVSVENVELGPLLGRRLDRRTADCDGARWPSRASTRRWRRADGPPHIPAQSVAGPPLEPCVLGKIVQKRIRHDAAVGRLPRAHL
jgi:hypothetical protein